MAPPRRGINQTSLVHPPQYADEGDNEASLDNYAKKLAGGGTTTWTAPLLESYMEKTTGETFRANTPGGTLQMQGRTKTGEDPRVTVGGLAADTPEGLSTLEWGFNAASQTKGPSRSRSWVRSYRDSDGNTIYEHCRGCKPQKTDISVSSQGVVEMTIAMFARRILEGPAAHAFAASEITAAPTNLKTAETSAEILKFAAMGSLIFDPKTVDTAGVRTIAGTEINYTDVSISAEWEEDDQTSAGEFGRIYQGYGGQKVTGSATFFKMGEKLNEAARKQGQYAAYLELEKPTATKKDAWAKLDIATSSSKKLTAYSKLPGTYGNDITITVLAGSASSVLGVEVRGKDITIQLRQGGSKYSEIADAINSHQYASALILAVHAAADGETIASTASAKTPLSGGTDGIRKILFERFSFEPSTDKIMGDSKSTMESKSFMADGGVAKIT